MKTYKATRDPLTNDVTVVVINDKGKERPLTHIAIHSPGGFEFGYWGSGPADLAIAILADHLKETPKQVQAYYHRKLGTYRGKGSRAINRHQSFKEQYVGIWDREQGGQVTSEEIDRFLASRTVSAQ